MTTPDRNEELLREMLERRASAPPPWLADEAIRAVRRVSQRRTTKARSLSRAAVIAVAGLAVATVAVVGGFAFGAGLLGTTGASSPQPSLDVGLLASSSPRPTEVAVLSPSAPPPPESTVRPDGSLPADSIAVVTTDGDGLRVRSAPGVGTDSKRLRPLLPKGTRMLVLDGPVTADGYEWYQVYTEPDRLAGWVAAGDDGVPWIKAGRPRCPQQVDAESLYDTAPIDLLLCVRNSPVEVAVPGVGDSGPAACDLTTDRTGCTWKPSWFGRQGYLFLGGFEETPPGEMGAISTIEVVLGEDVTDEDLEVGSRGAVVTLSLDHPDAQGCRVRNEAGEDTLEPWQAVLACRLRPVVESVRGN